MRLNTNLNSLNIFRNQKKNEIDNANALRKISSGKKILSAKDNPNKIGQSDELKIKIKSLQMAEKNLQDTNSMLQATEGSLSEISTLLLRMKELTVKGASDTNNESDKEIIQTEIDYIKDSIDEIIKGSTFNGRSLIGDIKVSDNNYPNNIKTTSGALSDETITIPKYNLKSQNIVDSKGNSIRDISIKTLEDSNRAIKTVNDGIALIGNVRSIYGSIQKRVENGAEYLNSVNITSEKALSALEDSDIALEIFEYSKSDILINASMALMSQSNKLPKEILSILERIRK
ncbi:flagellin [uncultured Clostridium sp.]|uniref:flagellin n=1 Tax=uncultured Clostridium sp. TaxID=59620 RepID=UPI00258297A4|nr:flagellin [uncultured Clostridium sp.]